MTNVTDLVSRWLGLGEHFTGFFGSCRNKKEGGLLKTVFLNARSYFFAILRGTDFFGVGAAGTGPAALSIWSMVA